MAKRILVPLDGTPLGEAVLPQVAEIARALDAEVEVLHVVPPRFVRGGSSAPKKPPPSPIGAPSALPAYSPSATVLANYHSDPSEIESNRRYVERVAEWLKNEGLRAEAVVVEGPDVPSVVLARAASAYMIAMAASQLQSRALNRFVFGSISEQILHTSRTPVLVVRVPNAAG